MKTRVFSLLLLLLVLIAPNSISGQLNYTGFSATNSAEFTFLQDAGINGTTIRLIRSAPAGGASTAAAVWHNQMHPVGDGFVAMFTFQIPAAGGHLGGGDGFAL